MTRDPLAWVGNRPPWAVRQRRRVLGRAITTGLLIMAALVYGITG
jgi:hypothetical protein